MKRGVAIGYLFNDEHRPPSMSWCHSVAELIEWDRQKYDPNPQFDRSWLIRDCKIGYYTGTDSLASSRNEVVRQFLKTDAEWLLWLDDDMGFAPYILDQLLSVAHPVERPIMGALCFMQTRIGQDGMGGYRCTPEVTIFDWQERLGQQALTARKTYPVNTVVKCEGTGSACILIHHSVFEKIKKEYGPFWYTRLTNDSTKALVGEDLSFCIRAGNNVHVYTGAKTSHLKQLWLSEEDFWQSYLAPPASEPVAVIVPVMKRPQNAAPFMRSVRASTGLAFVYAIADEDDEETRKAWHNAGANVIISDRGHTFAQKANVGYEKTDEPYLFLCGDDVHFHPGWYDQALHVSNEESLAVIGTDDLGNARVRSGEHATHALFKRSYIDEQGASWDGPKVFVSEAYRHNFCDDEWTFVAKQRGQFGFAKGSVVEHLHPLWGKTSNDEVYQKGRHSYDRDRKTWESRLREHR